MTMGNRIAKHIINSQTEMLEKSTYYILDAQGNTLNTYDHEVDANVGAVYYTLKERQIYGSSRLGIYDDSVSMYNSTSAQNTTLVQGHKYYEFSNHLEEKALLLKTDASFGKKKSRRNVLTVINDIKVPTSTNGTTVDGYLASIVNIADYSPFGVQLDGRTVSSDSYRYSFQGMEADDELKNIKGSSYDYGARMLDPRVGRWLSVDPLMGKYPSLSPYNFVGNSPLIFVDPDGERIKFAKNLSKSEKRTYKSELKCLRKGSPTFKKMYRDLKKSKDVYTYGKTDEFGGDNYDPETKTVAVNFKGNPQGFDLTTVIAHETGHAFRDLKKLDPLKSQNPYSEDSPESFAYNKNVELYYEYEALNIENIVRSELGLELREEYGEKSSFNSENTIEILGKERIDLSAKVPIIIKKDSSYDYNNTKQDHIKNILNRSKRPKDIKVKGDQNQKDYE